MFYTDVVVSSQFRLPVVPIAIAKSAMRLTSAGLLVGTGKVKRESLPESKLTDMVVTMLIQLILT